LTRLGTLDDAVHRIPPLPDLARSLCSGDLALSDYIDSTLLHLEQVEPKIHSLLPEEGRAARLREESAEIARVHPAASARPPLYGVVVGVKDIFRVDGFETRAGSRLPSQALAGKEAESVGRLRQAGALVLGKTVTTEFAYFAPGPTRNPRHLEHTPGGSSSGSAAAVAAGLCPLSLGTQTIGSIVRPAAFCGVVGFKPTYGRIPADGVIPLAPSLDHVGLFTYDACGAEYAAAILCDRWKASGPQPLPVLGIPDGPYLAQAGEVSRLHFERALAALAHSGYAVRTVKTMPDFDDVVRRHQVILAAEAARVHGEWFSRFEGLYHTRTAELLREGRQIDASALAAALDGQAILRRELHTAMEDAAIDLWIAPSTVGPAPLGLDSTGDPIMNLPWTQAGLPAINLPFGEDPEGLPLGVQLVSRWYDDERLLAWATMIESELREPSRALASPEAASRGPARGV